MQIGFLARLGRGNRPSVWPSNDGRCCWTLRGRRGQIALAVAALDRRVLDLLRAVRTDLHPRASIPTDVTTVIAKAAKTQAPVDPASGARRPSRRTVGAAP